MLDLILTLSTNSSEKYVSCYCRPARLPYVWGTTFVRNSVTGMLLCMYTGMYLHRTYYLNVYSKLSCKRKFLKLSTLTVDIQNQHFSLWWCQIGIRSLTNESSVQMLPSNVWEGQCVHCDSIWTLFVRIVYYHVLEVPRHPGSRSTWEKNKVVMRLENWVFIVEEKFWLSYKGKCLDILPMPRAKKLILSF